ncbi:unnamed protein product [Phyllotreta striolata]|uniref:THAP-type domain-containing protein n=1 Tax=Phyllotreta striolata TaxID=444603 RepID=A0A9N9THW5_PHYSR|nr:unnamed protein product [Phyllotreta striolata]
MSLLKSELNSLLTSVPDYIQKVKCDATEKTPPFKCAVKTCFNSFLRYKDHINCPYKFHKFPVTNKSLCNVWKLKCGLNRTDDVEKLMVCSDHFSLDDYLRNYKEEFTNPNFKRTLKPTVYPNLKLGKLEKPEDNINSNEESQMETNTDSPESEEDESQREFLNEVRKEVDYNKELTEKLDTLQKKLNKLQSTSKHLSAKQRKVIINKKAEDLRVLKKFFSDTQIKLLMGQEATWTNDDLARAFTIRHMGSKKCYLYMKNTLNIPLPSLSCLQKWANS